MKIFVSWSGERGRMFAEAVFALFASTDGEARVEPWMSTRIRHGKPWAIELLGRLGECEAGVVCLTSDTVGSRWLAFEAGAIVGAGAKPDKVVGLGLDLEPGMLSAQVMDRFNTFDVSSAGLGELWRRLRPGSEPAWTEAAWQRFSQACAAVPPPATRPFTLILYLPAGLFMHPIETVDDHPFDDVLSQVMEFHGHQSTAAERVAFRCLDIDAGKWLPTPRRLSLVRVPRLVVLHPDVISARGGSDVVLSVQLKESIDVIPKVNLAIAVLTRDLRELLATQISFQAANGRYAGSLEELGFLPAPGNQLNIAAGEHGFAAQGRSAGVPSMYGVRVGDGAGYYADKPEGAVFLDSLTS